MCFDDGNSSLTALLKLGHASVNTSLGGILMMFLMFSNTQTKFLASSDFVSANPKQALRNSLSTPKISINGILNRFTPKVVSHIRVLSHSV